MDHSQTDSITITDITGQFSYVDTNSASSGVSVTGINVPWTTTTTTDSITVRPWSQPTSTKIRLDGPEADIEVNGESLMSAIRKIEERLNILKPNEKLEEEWDQLRELGEQYRTLEKKLNEQSKMWNALKKMPPPEIK